VLQRSVQDFAGFYYYRARYYDPQARQFISEDPIGLDGGINLYAYVGNNPIGLTDPSGLKDDFVAATRGLENIKTNDFSRPQCRELLDNIVKTDGVKMKVDDLIKKIHKVAGEVKLEDGEKSTVELNENEFPGARDDKHGITTMNKWFDRSVEAAGNMNTPVIYLHAGQWDGGFFHYKYAKSNGDPSNYGLATLNYGLATLLHEILHKRIVSGQFITHDNMFPKVGDIGSRSAYSNDPYTGFIMHRCFPEK
jgi:RHS repeat-associated protein